LFSNQAFVMSSQTRSSLLIGHPAEVRTGTILLVEDNDLVLNVLRDALALDRHSVLLAPSGVEALRLAAQHRGRIDVLLADVVLPDMTGPQLAARLKELHPEAAVIFASGHPEDVIRRCGIFPDGPPFLQKPFPLALLQATVQLALGSRCAPDARRRVHRTRHGGSRRARGRIEGRAESAAAVYYPG
jgi:CheY-like chemotaxis protein